MEQVEKELNNSQGLFHKIEIFFSMIELFESYPSNEELISFVKSFINGLISWDRTSFQNLKTVFICNFKDIGKTYISGINHTNILFILMKLYYYKLKIISSTEIVSDKIVSICRVTDTFIKNFHRVILQFTNIPNYLINIIMYYILNSLGDFLSLLTKDDIGSLLSKKQIYGTLYRLFNLSYLLLSRVGSIVFGCKSNICSEFVREFQEKYKEDMPFKVCSIGFINLDNKI